MIKNSVDRQYLKFIRHILENGVVKEDRTGTGTISVFGYDMRFDMRQGFPLLTSKKMFTKGIIHELIWFLRGDTNIKYLLENGVHIWDGDCYKNYLSKIYVSSIPSDRNFEFATFGPESYKIGNPFTKDQFLNKILTDSDFCNRWGDLGPIYGKQWRRWESFNKSSISGPGLVSEVDSITVSQIDQIQELIDLLKTSPDSRRLLVNAWNPSDVPKSVLPPCHYGFQCWTREMTNKERIDWFVSNNKDMEDYHGLSDKKLDSLRVPKRYLSLKWIQRSVDSGLGLPFNIASYGLLLHILAREVNMVPLDLIFSGGDCHIYLNHIETIKTQLDRETFTLPRVVLTNESIDSLSYDDVKIVGYHPSDILPMTLSN